MPGPKYSVDTHPKRSEIVKAIIKGQESTRGIAKRYGISATAIQRYLNDKLTGAAAKVSAAKDEKEGKALHDRVETIMVRMQKLYDACDAWLTDPTDPTKYNLDPKAWEIDIVYRTVEPDTDKMITRKESLQTLLDKLDERGYQPWEVRHKVADPRKLIIETANAMARQLELVAKIEGAITEQIVNVTVNQYWLEMKTIILKATEGFPQVREKIVRELEKGI
jgi:hypothetical protein